MSGNRTASARLAIGAALGVAAAAAGLLLSARGEGRALPANAVARVNGQSIPIDEYRRVAYGVAADQRERLSETERRRVVDRLIDEELLLQRGLELGLAHSDHKVRADIVAAVIATAESSASSAEPTPEEIAKFYAENGEMFQVTARARLRQLFFRRPNRDEAAKIAAEATRRLRAGEPFEKVHASLGDPEVSPIPDALLPPSKLVDYVGPTVLRAALALAPGEVTDPVRSAQGVHVVELVERDTPTRRPLEEVRGEIVAEIRRRRDEAALRSYLDRLRREASIEIRKDAL